MSFQLRAGVRTLLAIMLFGGVLALAATLAPVLDRQGWLHPLVQNAQGHPVPADMSAIMAEYFECQSYTDVARSHGLHRPDMRRAMGRIGQALRDSATRQEQALGWLVWHRY